MLLVPLRWEVRHEPRGLEATRDLGNVLRERSIGVVPERVLVPERDVRWVLVRTSAVRRGRAREQHPAMSEHAIDRVHQPDFVWDVLEEVARSNDAS